MTEKVYTIHDAFFKKAMQNPQAARHFVERFFSQDVLNMLQLDTLKLEPAEFIDDNLRKTASDVLFRVQTNKKKMAYIYLLLEHQRRPDKLMPYRLAKYTIRIIDHHLIIHKTKILPLVVPLVVYNGENAYPYSMRFWDLFEPHEQDKARQIWIDPLPLLDLSSYDTREVKDDSWISMALNALKFGSSSMSPDKMIELMEKATIDLADKGELIYIQSVYRYLCEAKDAQYESALWISFRDRLQSKLGEKFMTSIADSFRQEGIKQGMQQGIHQGVYKASIALKKLQQSDSVNIEKIAETTGLSIEDIKILQKSLMHQ